MTAPLALDPARTALVLVDLMDRIVALPLEPRKGTEVLSAAEELAAAFRAVGAPVVLVRVQRPGVADQPPGSGLVAYRAGRRHRDREADHRRVPGHGPGRAVA